MGDLGAWGLGFLGYALVGEGAKESGGAWGFYGVQAVWGASGVQGVQRTYGNSGGFRGKGLGFRELRVWRGRLRVEDQRQPGLRFGATSDSADPQLDRFLINY